MPSLVHHQRYRHPHTHTPTHTNTHLPLMFLLYLRTRQTLRHAIPLSPTTPCPLTWTLISAASYAIPLISFYIRTLHRLSKPQHFSFPLPLAIPVPVPVPGPHSSRLTSSRVSFHFLFPSCFCFPFRPPRLFAPQIEIESVFSKLLRFLLSSSLGSRAPSSSSSFLRHLSQSMPTKKTKLAIHFPPFVRSFVRARIFDTCI
jgi:hypothetical protein